MKKYEKWCDILKEAWINNDTVSIISLFDNNATYYETPFKEIITNDRMWDIWKELGIQKIDTLNYRILTADEESAIINFIAIEGSKITNFIYHIKLNKHNKCIYFKQWYMTNNQ